MYLRPEWKTAGWLIMGAYMIWTLTRLDAEAHRIVEVSQSQWEGKSTYEKEFRKYRRWIRWTCLICIFLSLAASIEATIPLLR
jgi:hypothetical protein